MGLRSVKYIDSEIWLFWTENWGFSHWNWDFRSLGVELEAYWDPKNNFGWEMIESEVVQVGLNLYSHRPFSYFT